MKRCAFNILSALLITFVSLSGTTPAEESYGMFDAPELDNVGMIKSMRHSIPVQLGGMSQGTAFLVAPQYVVTASHCVQSERIVALFGDQVRLCTPYAEDRTRDWAVLKLDRPLHHVTPVKVSRRTSMYQGELFRALGFGRGNWGMTAILWDGETMRGHIVGGMSGGPILDASGAVVSINCFSSNSLDGVCGGNNPLELDEWLIELGIIQ